MEKKYKIILGLVVLLGFLVRVVGISDPDTGFYVDEASLGYNARSIWETGSDEYGQKIPMAFRSFGDYKSPLFVYAAIPLVNVFGEMLGVRLTAALLGTMTIWLVAEIAKKLSGNKAGLIAGATLAILPWHVNLSRHGIEAVLASALLAGALLLFVSKKYRAGLVILALSTLAYHATKYVSPLLAFIVVAKLWRGKTDFNKTKTGWVLVGMIWLIVLMINVQPFSNTRALGVQQDFSLRNLLAAYVSYFNPRILMLGDWQVRNNIYGVSNVWLWTIALFYAGIWKAFKKNRFGFFVILATLFLSPLPASATIDPFHSIRALTMVIPISILAGIGGGWILTNLGGWQASNPRGWLVGVAVIIGFQMFFLSERVLVQNKLTAYGGWLGGYEQLVDEVLKLDTTGYTQVVVDTTDRAAMYSLWQVFGGVDTKQKIPLPHRTNYYESFDWLTPESLILKNHEEVFFKPVYWPEDQKEANVLYVGSVWRFDPDAIRRAGAEVMVEIKDPTGKIVWMAVATKD
jgi:4-amino-4-deoxy-L-arabinose transferase-like glycosyltransferase